MRCLVIFAKEPKENMVKTRLKGCLSSLQRMELYKAFLKDTLEIAKRVDCELRVIAYLSDKKAPQYLKQIAPGFSFYKQRGKDLGIRMHNALKSTIAKGASCTVIIGSDAPTLPLKYLNNSFKRLDNADIVLGPSRDGGYYLIGLKEPCLDLFKGIRWSAKTVFLDTLRKIKKLKKTLSLLPYWYDVDEPSALERLKQDLKKREDRGTAKWTRQFLNPVRNLL